MSVPSPLGKSGPVWTQEGSGSSAWPLGSPAKTEKPCEGPPLYEGFLRANPGHRHDGQTANEFLKCSDQLDTNR